MPKTKTTKPTDDVKKLLNMSSSEYTSAIQLNYFEKNLKLCPELVNHNSLVTALMNQATVMRTNKKAFHDLSTLN